MKLLEIFIFFSQNPGFCQTLKFCLKLQIVFFTAETVYSNNNKIVTQLCLNQKLTWTYRHIFNKNDIVPLVFWSCQEFHVLHWKIYWTWIFVSGHSSKTSKSLSLLTVSNFWEKSQGFKSRVFRFAKMTIKFNFTKKITFSK